jgi:probable rRNA maturation factor
VSTAGRRRAAAPRATVSILGLRRFAGLPARATLARWVRMAVLDRARIVLVFTGTRPARELNRRYRHQDHATNVLTFGYQTQAIAVADIVICVPVARAEAKDLRLTLRSHLAHLVIHGVLHAQGFDHLRDADARRMQKLEVEFLGRLRIADPYRSIGA